MNEYFFKCIGGFDVDKNLKAIKGSLHETIKFELPDGRTVDLFVGLHVNNPDGTEEYLYNMNDFEALGLKNQCYDTAEFVPVDEENEVGEIGRAHV